MTSVGGLAVLVGSRSYFCPFCSVCVKTVFHPRGERWLLRSSPHISAASHREEQKQNTEQAVLPAGSLPALPFLEVSLPTLTHRSLDFLRELQLAPRGVGKRAPCGWLPVLLELAAVGRRGEQGLGGNRRPELPQQSVLAFVGGEVSYLLRTSFSPPTEPLRVRTYRSQQNECRPPCRHKLEQPERSCHESLSLPSVGLELREFSSRGANSATS